MKRNGMGNKTRTKNLRALGTQMEQMVCDFLTRNGYLIRETNYFVNGGEIDIIAHNEGYLVFIEVKYRKNEIAGYPSEAVDWRKQQKISRVAMHYLLRYGFTEDTPVRFDVVSVLGEADCEIHILKNAFDFCGEM
ncbi:MAG: YraN family protein [bacterium]|nr:YraN family protein [bacterium]